MVRIKPEDSYKVPDPGISQTLKHFKNQLRFLSRVPTLYLPSESTEDKNKAPATVHCHHHFPGGAAFGSTAGPRRPEDKGGPAAHGGGVAQPKAPGGLVLISSLFSHRLWDRVRAAPARAWAQGALSGEGATPASAQSWRTHRLPEGWSLIERTPPSVVVPVATPDSPCASAPGPSNSLCKRRCKHPTNRCLSAPGLMTLPLTPSTPSPLLPDFGPVPPQPEPVTPAPTQGLADSRRQPGLAPGPGEDLLACSHCLACQADQSVPRILQFPHPGRGAGSWGPPGSSLFEALISGGCVYAAGSSETGEELPSSPPPGSLLYTA